MQKIVCIIPARLASTRFPRKMLAPLGGLPLIQRTWMAAVESAFFHEVVVAVDDKELYDCVTGFGGHAIMTSPDCLTGTDRLIELQRRGLVEADIWVNWQGDEPFVCREMVQDLLQSGEREEEGIWTLCKRIENSEEVHSPHVAKVVRDAKGQALYFSRSPIPYFRDEGEEKIYFKHIGLYAFSNEALRKISTLPITWLEEVEKLEMVRFIVGGLKIKVHETGHEVFGIDLPEQLEKAHVRLQLGPSSGTLSRCDHSRIS